jgi:hypothetical protein
MGTGPGTPAHRARTLAAGPVAAELRAAAENDPAERAGAAKPKGPYRSARISPATPARRGDTAVIAGARAEAKGALNAQITSGNDRPAHLSLICAPWCPLGDHKLRRADEVILACSARPVMPNTRSARWLLIRPRAASGRLRSDAG